MGRLIGMRVDPSCPVLRYNSADPFVAGLNLASTKLNI